MLILQLPYLIVEKSINYMFVVLRKYVLKRNIEQTKYRGEDQMEKVIAVLVLTIGLLAVSFTIMDSTKDISVYYVTDIPIGDKMVSVNVVEVRSNGLTPILGFGENRLDGAEELNSIVNRYQAEVGITGGYFQAYAKPNEPWCNIISEGRVLHVGDVGTSIGFTKKGNIKLDTLRIYIEGGTVGSNDWPNNWYAYGFNHTPSPGSDAVYIFTPDRGERIGFAYGTSVVVEDSMITRVTENEDVKIPQNGYVINLMGSEKYLLDRLKEGRTISYSIIFKDMNGNLLNWEDVITAVGAGPRLITDGKITLAGLEEGFREDKILTKAYSRAAIGVKEDGTILLVTTPALTMDQLAYVMQSLGSKNAMNFDGGASTGLYYKGEYITKPHRPLNNVLLFKKP